jgi:hypothetical protein
MAAEFGPAVEWKASAIGYRTNMGDHIDLPLINVKEWKPRRKW